MKERVLYALAKTGKTLKWSVEVVENDNCSATIIRRSSQLDGKESENHKVISKGTNIGKANEHTPYESAVVKASKYWLSKVEDNWHESIDNIGKVIYLKPMLAKPYDEKKVKFPCIVQPKMNGVRCTSYRHLDDETMWSRERNEFTTMGHIQDRIEANFGKYSPDGELYIHGETFEHIISLVKKYRKGESETVQYWIYDLAIPDTTFFERMGIIDEIFDRMYLEDREIFIEVPSLIVNNKEELKAVHDGFVREGYEGLIIRTFDGLYGFNDRPWDLIKYKEFIDSEFKIIGFKAEVWHDILNDCYRNLIIFECICENGETFDVRPNGSFLKREIMYNHGLDYINKMATVRYQNLSEAMIPIFPIFIGIRDYE